MLALIMLEVETGPEVPRQTYLVLNAVFKRASTYAGPTENQKKERKQSSYLRQVEGNLAAGQCLKISWLDSEIHQGSLRDHIPTRFTPAATKEQNPLIHQQASCTLGPRLHTANPQPQEGGPFRSPYLPGET